MTDLHGFTSAVCERHVVLLGVGALLADDLEQQVGPLAGGDCGQELDRLVVVQLRLELAAEDDVAGEACGGFRPRSSLPV